MITTGKSEGEDLEQRITDELIISGYKLIPGRILTSCLVVAIVIAVMWSQISPQILTGWGGLMVCAIIFADYNARTFLQQENSGNVKKMWKMRMLLAPATLGSSWGAALFIFYNHGNVEQQIFLITVIISICVLGVLRGIYYLPLYYVYVIPIFSALIITFAIQDTLTSITLAVLMAWSLIFQLTFSRMLNRTMRSEMRLRYEGYALADELQKKTEQAQAATLAKSRFLAAANHDLRQPLHALSLFVDVLKESKSDEERASIIPRIDLSLDALRKLFDALLDMSRLDAKVVKPECSHFDLAELLNALAEEFKVATYKKNLKLKLHARQTIVYSDRLLLERILRNLISNAIRYTDSGGILLSARQRGDRVLLQVWDTGIGIPQESQQEIFVEFQQLHNAHRDRTQGLGLGLALVKRLCHLLDHSLTLNSREGKGSVFSLCINSGDSKLLQNKNAAAIMHRWDLDGSRVLVIDDEPEILIAMHTLLSKWGCETIAADSLDNAMQKLKEKHIVPDLVLSDLRLRDNKTGIEAIDAVRQIYGQSIPGILITGDTEPQRINIAKQSGYELLQKPVRPVHLRSVIQHYLTAAEE